MAGNPAILPRMTTIQRAATLLVVLLTVAAAAAAQDTGKSDAYSEEMRKADMLASRKQFEPALQSYKKAYSLSGKTSSDALVGMAIAYRGLGGHKNVLSVCKDGMKLAGEDKRQQAKFLNLKGASLVALAEKPRDKELVEAEQTFRAALEADPELYAAQLNLGVALLKQERDEEGVRALKAYVEHLPKGAASPASLANTLKMIEEPRRAREIYAPDFSLTTKQGEYMTLEDLKGKIVVLDFWGTWCGPCRQATPGLVKLNRKYAEQGVVFLGIAERDEEDKWAPYIEKNKMEWPQFLDTTRKMVPLFQVFSYPTYIVIDAEGIVRARKSGYGPDTDGWLESEIKKALKNARN